MPGAYWRMTMAKQTVKSKGPTRKQMAHREREQKLQKTLVWVTIGVVGLIVLIMGYGLVTEVVIKAGKAVASVDGANIVAREYQHRLYYERLLARRELDFYQSYLYQLDPNNPETQDLYQQFQYSAASLENQLGENMATLFGKQVLDSVIEEMLVRKEAEARGLALDADAVQLRLEQMLGYDRNATQTVTDTTEIQSYDELYSDLRENILKASRFSEADFLAMVEAGVLKDSVELVLSGDVITVADQVETIFLTTDNEEDALVFQQRIQEGEPAESLLEEFNSDEITATAGYSLPWLPLGYLGTQLGEEIEKVAFKTPVGRASVPTLANDGQYYVIYVIGHEERELSESLLDQARADKYTAWLEQQMQERVEYLAWPDAVLTEP